MSDFLNQFNDSNSRSDRTPSKTGKTNPHPVAADIEREYIENRNYAEQKKEVINVKYEDISAIGGKQDAAIHGPIHEVEIDSSFHRTKLIKAAIIAVAVLALCVTGFLIYRSANAVEVKNLTDSDINDAKSWALRNRIDLDVKEVFNLKKNKDIIISQSPEDGKIQKGGIVSVTVSKGADPDEQLPLPDFSTMDAAQIRAWRDENLANGVNVIQEYNEEIEKGGFIKSEFPDDTVNAENFRRKDTINVYVSRGEENKENLKNISVPNFSKKTKEEAEMWAETNKIRLSVEESPSDAVLEGLIMSQTVKAGEKLAVNDELAVTVSLGKGVTVPNFNALSLEKAMTAQGLTVDVTQEYNSGVAYGKVISQSVEAGTVLYKEDKEVSVIYSLGKPFIDNMVGMSEKELPSYFYDFTSKGANISYAVYYVDSYEPKGTVVYSSHNSEYIPMSLNVEIHISLGNLQPPEPIIPEPSEMPNMPNMPTDPNKY